MRRVNGVYAQLASYRPLFVCQRWLFVVFSRSSSRIATAAGTLSGIDERISLSQRFHARFATFRLVERRLVESG